MAFSPELVFGILPVDIDVIAVSAFGYKQPSVTKTLTMDSRG